MYKIFIMNALPSSWSLNNKYNLSKLEVPVDLTCLIFLLAFICSSLVLFPELHNDMHGSSAAEDNEAIENGFLFNIAVFTLCRYIK